MTSLFANLRTRPLSIRAIALLAYGAISFVLIYVLGSNLLDNVLLSLILEGFWFLHILYVVNQLADGSSEFFTLAVCGLMPGLLKNMWLAFNL